MLKQILSSEIDQLKTLISALTLPECDDDLKIDILEEIELIVSNIDMANDFGKVGGYDAIMPLLQSEESEVVAGVWWVLGTIAQNNPEGQALLMEMGVVEMLVGVLRESRDVLVLKKAVYAASCLTKQNDDGFKVFVEQGGDQVFLELMDRAHIGVKARIMFLMNMLIMNHDLEEDFVKGMLKHVGELLDSEMTKTKVFDLLVTVARKCPDYLSGLNDIKEKIITIGQELKETGIVDRSQVDIVLNYFK
eukprot:TRINITY_DN2394_c0_g1_i1.p1 TRINITY_DN2394_c0_g1~~TRINITY_DN2394_c0_g1_i1.p1  ORF type:complete len:291 (+),score=81.03 TRINITY_DN2394_c0_g1_i1:128-874(+)